ncbi:MAG: hypothetical protein ACD_43C00067G0003 [uncultured bacterium]|nr:MAG: hypothetical protein ACD_43C00067G0003 [uncultured bacterium]
MTQSWLEHVWRAITKTVKLPQTIQLNIVVVGDAYMKTMNQRYRGVTKVTDVLSFGYNKTCGDVVVCYPQAKRQARTKQQSLQRECAWLVVHGILHWRGYDHECAADAQVMRSLEQRILSYV